MKDAKPLIIIGSDHAGYKTKQHIVTRLAKKGYTFVDVGSFDPSVPDDYPDYAYEVAKAVASDKTGHTKGVLICGSGTGMVIAANKVRGIRASVVYDNYSAKMARYDNDANIIALRSRKFDTTNEAQWVDLFMKTEFSNLPRHKRRIKKIAALEKRS
jgi:ribose 5-phosphate isomerase B